MGTVPGVFFRGMRVYLSLLPDGMTQCYGFPEAAVRRGRQVLRLTNTPAKGNAQCAYNLDDYPLISRYARALKALARPFAPVSRALRYPVHGSLLTKNSGGLLYAPPGNHKPAYIPEFENANIPSHHIQLSRRVHHL